MRTNDRNYKYRKYTVQKDGFAGYLLNPSSGNEHVVIVIVGGKRSVIDGKKIAERFAEFGIAGISVPMYGDKGQTKDIDRVDLDFMNTVVETLRRKEGFKYVSVYGFSVGSVYAAMTARLIKGIDNAILVAPSHVAFEGSNIKKKQMTGHSMVMYKGKELSFVRPDFFHSGYLAKYVFDEDVKRDVTNMWEIYKKSYKDKLRESKAYYELEKSNCRYLFVAGSDDEVWPSEYSINFMLNKLDNAGYKKEYKALIYPHGSHIIGMIPSRDKYKWQKRMLWLIGKIYKSFSLYRSESTRAINESEKAITDFILST